MSQGTTSDRTTLLSIWADLEPERCRKAGESFQLWLGCWQSLESHPYGIQFAVEQALMARGWFFDHYYKPVSLHAFVVEVPCRGYSSGYSARDVEAEMAALRAYVRALRSLS